MKTAKDYLVARIDEARQRFKYIPDSTSSDPLVQISEDEWDTIGEFESRGGGDCDGWSVWAIERAAHDAGEPFDRWHFIVGRVLIEGKWKGHAWVELDVDGAVLWADPTWGRGPDTPEWFGYPKERHPLQRWTFDGTLFVRPEQYMEVSR